MKPSSLEGFGAVGTNGPVNPAPANAELLNFVVKAVPYPHQLSDIDVHSQPDVLRFTWRGARYRVSDTLSVEEMQDGCLCGTDNAILMERLLKLVSFSTRCGSTVLPA